ncbi:MAG: DnaA ATPase domain-containing protein, partial [Dehalococcoidales bacterium]
MGARSAREIWDAALGELQIQVSKPNYRTWLEKTAGLNYEDNHFVVSVPNTFVAEYLDKNQRSLIEKTLISLTSSPDIKVAFQVDGRYKNSESVGGVEWKTSPATQTDSPRFKPNYVFDSFTVGHCNRLAYVAAQVVAQNPGYSYNPLFIYGGVGLGKTHLLHAIGHVALANHIKVICVSAEQFTNEFVNAIREKKTDEFQKKYRSAGMLLIDDIHFIIGKEQTEESFFHTFNELHNANRQIVIT